MDSRSLRGFSPLEATSPPDPAGAVQFYGQVVGFTHRAIDMGPAGTYYLLSKGGVDRAGVTSHLVPGVPPHWLPYVEVDDADAVVGGEPQAAIQRPGDFRTVRRTVELTWHTVGAVVQPDQDTVASTRRPRGEREQDDVFQRTEQISTRHLFYTIKQIG